MFWDKEIEKEDGADDKSENGRGDFEKQKERKDDFVVWTVGFLVETENGMNN